MATNAGLRLAPMATHTATIVAIELLAAAQGVELRAPLETSPKLQDALRLDPGRGRVLGARSSLRSDLAKVRSLVERGVFMPFLKGQHMGQHMGQQIFLLRDG